MDLPPAQFFKGSPMLEVIDFLERLAPLSEPKRLARDEKPLRSVDTVIDILASLARHPAKSLGIVEDEEYPDEEDAQAATTPAGTTPGDTPPAAGGYDAYQALRQSLGRD